MSPNNGQPDRVTRMVTPGQGGKATIQITVPTRPRSMQATKTATAEVSDPNESEATPISNRPSRRPFSQNVRFESYNHLQDKVVLRLSTHKNAGSPREAWHQQGPSISIEGQNYTSEQLSPRQSVKFKRVPLKKISPITQQPGGAPNMALQAASVSPYDRVKAAVARSKATTNSNRARYDPDLVKCHLCPEVSTLSVIQNHIATYHSHRSLVDYLAQVKN